MVKIQNPFQMSKIMGFIYVKSVRFCNFAGRKEMFKT